MKFPNKAYLQPKAEEKVSTFSRQGIRNKESNKASNSNVGQKNSSVGYKDMKAKLSKLSI